MKYSFLLLSLLCIISCDSSRLKEIPYNQFTGKWKLTDRGILEGIEIEITEDSLGNFAGHIVKLNDNKYVRLFMEEQDRFITGIKRNSNFEFVITERKIAAPLFSAYGQSTSTEFTAQFDGKDKLLLGENGSKGSYVKISE